MKKLNPLSCNYWWADHSPDRGGGEERLLPWIVAPGRRWCRHHDAFDSSSRFPKFNLISRRKILNVNERACSGSAQPKGVGR